MLKVIVAVLDWGLGHATRSIPVIQELLRCGNSVLLAGNGESLELLKREFPSLAAYQLPAYAIEYPRKGSMAVKLLRQLPRLRRVVASEHRMLEELVAQEHIDLVISDNRYGCWSLRVPAIIITHQTTILVPRYLQWLRPAVLWYNRRLIYRFTQCWIPDYPGAHSLAGRLAHFPEGSPGRFRFIGNLSRFDGAARIAGTQPLYDIVVVLSGPEPQRTVMEDIVLEQLPGTSLRAFVVRGTRHPARPLPAKIAGVDFLDTTALEGVLMAAPCILARSGYSTIMDLARLGKKAIFIPTPGQTEQEYLARRLKKMKIAYSASQRQFNLRRAWRASRSYSGFNFMPDRFEQYRGHVSGLLEWMLRRSSKKTTK